jgi:hypothetical protein
MKRNVLFFITIAVVFQSCGFLFYNYRASIDSNFIIPNENQDTIIRYKVGQLIYRQSLQTKLYGRFASEIFDTLSFYGPDYHTLNFRIKESDKSTNIHFTYFGFNGSRKKPPNKLFIQAIRDSLKIEFGATEVVVKDFNNEKKKKNN